MQCSCCHSTQHTPGKAQLQVVNSSTQNQGIHGRSPRTITSHVHASSKQKQPQLMAPDWKCMRMVFRGGMSRGVGERGPKQAGRRGWGRGSLPRRCWSLRLSLRLGSLVKVSTMSCLTLISASSTRGCLSHTCSHPQESDAEVQSRTAVLIGHLVGHAAF